MQSGQEMATGGRVSQAAGATPPIPYDGFDRMPIGGDWRSGRSGKKAADRDPYTGEILLEIELGDARDVDEAYRAAEAAQPAWAAMLPQDRRDVLDRASAIMGRRKQEIVDWLIKESGSTRRKAELEWQFTHLYMLEAAGYPFHVEGRILPAVVSGKESRVYRGPAGVVGVISPWNFPLHLSNRSVAPALAVGNAVVLEPASDTPVTGGLLLAKIFEEAGLPPGVLNVVVGASEDIGDAFIDHPVPRVLSFTGSTPVGCRIGEHARRNVTRVCLELGGNGPFIVLDDADLDRAVDAAVAGKFMHQEEEAIRIANDTEYGLSSAVFTRDVEHGVSVAKRIRAGMTHVNDWPVDDEPNTAFGGEKASGLGRFGGAWALEEFTTDHWISVQEQPRRYPI